MVLSVPVLPVPRAVLRELPVAPVAPVVLPRPVPVALAAVPVAVLPKLAVARAVRAVPRPRRAAVLAAADLAGDEWTA